MSCNRVAKIIPIFVVASVIFLGCAGEPEIPKIVLDSNLGQGTLTISGTIELPEDASSGRQMNLEVREVAGFQEVVGGVQTTGATSVDYEINNLPDGDFRVRLRVDETGNLMLGDKGDFEGWYNGTVDNPIFDFDSAATITLSGSSVSDMDFGIGEVP